MKPSHWKYVFLRLSQQKFAALFKPQKAHFCNFKKELRSYRSGANIILQVGKLKPVPVTHPRPDTRDRLCS